MTTPETVLQNAVDGATASPAAKPEPPVGSERWNEVYGKMKNFERKLTERETEFQETLQGIQEHNRMLAEKLEKIEDGIDDGNRPDPTVDPEAYELYVTGKVQKTLDRAKAKTVAPPVVKKDPTADDVARINEQAEALTEVFNDYPDVAKEVMPLLQKDEKLAQKIFSSKNPPAALYKFGIEQRKRSAEHAENLDAGYVEGGTPPAPPDDKTALTPLQDRVRQGLGLTVEQYQKQLKAAGR